MNPENPPVAADLSVAQAPSAPAPAAVEPSTVTTNTAESPSVLVDGRDLYAFTYRDPNADPAQSFSAIHGYVDFCTGEDDFTDAARICYAYACAGQHGFWYTHHAVSVAGTHGADRAAARRNMLLAAVQSVVSVVVAAEHITIDRVAGLRELNRAYNRKVSDWATAVIARRVVRLRAIDKYRLHPVLLRLSGMPSAGSPHAILQYDPRPRPIYGPEKHIFRTAGSLLGRLIAAMRCENATDCLPGDGAAEDVVEEVSSQLLNYLTGYTGRMRLPTGPMLDKISEAVDASPWCHTVPLVRADCGHVTLADDVHHDGHNNTYCAECAEDLVEPEDGNGEKYLRDDLIRWRGGYYLHRPAEMQRALRGNSLLQDWSTPCDRLDHDKSFTPSPLGDFTMGIELEVQAGYDGYDDDDDDDYDGDGDGDDGRTSRAAAISKCDEHFNGSCVAPYAMFKRDGSLSSSRGFEIVTAARRLDDHIEKFKAWVPQNLEAWDAGCCGMHVHIDSRAFSALTLGKFLMFMNDSENAKFIRGIAGRHPHYDDQAADYAAAIDQDFVENPRVVKQGDIGGRYKIVNLTNLTGREQDRLGCEVDRSSKGNYSTVEIRIFRATLRKQRLLAQIEFAHAAVAFCRVASWQNLTGDAFREWLNNTACYPHLTRWFGSKVRNARYSKPACNVAEAHEV